MIHSLLTFAAILAGCSAQFDYDLFAEDWLEDFPGCAGREQSPINIITEDAEYEDFTIELRAETMMVTGSILNAGGHTYEFTPDNPDITLINPLTEEPYTLAQFHFHWDERALDTVPAPEPAERDASRGSEHTRDSMSYPLEMHLVFYKSEFEDATAAVNAGGRDNLAVVGQWFDIGDEAIPALESITRSADRIVEVDEEFELEDTIDVLSLIANFTGETFTYEGSLTTPGCTQVVQWFMLNQHGVVTEEQLNRMYTILRESPEGTEPLTIGHNWRPTQPMNGRTVMRNFLVADEGGDGDGEGNSEEDSADDANENDGSRVVVDAASLFVICAATALSSLSF